MKKSKVIFVTGGQRSGKSMFAENLVLSMCDNPIYLATALIKDEETARRVEIHRRRRGDSWTTVEAPLSLDADLSAATVLFDCLTMFATNHLMEKEDINMTLDAVKTELDRLFSNEGATIVVVTNETGLGGISPNKMQRAFTDMQGTLNQYVAGIADEAYMIVSGLPLKLK